VSYVVAAVVLGIGIGYLRGGRLLALATAPVHWWPVLAAAVALQVASLTIDTTLGARLLLASFALLIVFTARNFTRAGMGIVLVGVAMNALVIAVNSGMPVRKEAIIASGLAEADEIDELDFNAKWHLETDDDRLTFLADIIPVPGVGEVLSFGDLVMAVGVADVIVHLMRPAGALSRRELEETGSRGSG
jgi:hypothetical protein